MASATKEDKPTATMRLVRVDNDYATYVEPSSVIAVEETDDAYIKSHVYLRGGKVLKSTMCVEDVLTALGRR